MKSATCRSKTVQNEIIAICKKLHLSKLTSEVRKAKFVAVLADETADVLNKEQLALML